MSSLAVPITLKSMDGTDTKIDVDLRSNCNVLYNKVESLHQNAINIKLTYAGKKLEPGVPLKDYGIGKFSIVYAVFAIKGGGL